MSGLLSPQLSSSLEVVMAILWCGTPAALQEVSACVQVLVWKLHYVGNSTLYSRVAIHLLCLPILVIMLKPFRKAVW